MTVLVSAAELEELKLYEGKGRGEINVTIRRKFSRDGILPQRSAPLGTAQMILAVCQARDVNVGSGQAGRDTPERFELFNASINDNQQNSCSLREPIFRSPDPSHVPQLATPETGVGAGPVFGPASQAPALTTPAGSDVVNISDKPLTIMEYRVLSKGRNVCPTMGHFNGFQLFNDFSYRKHPETGEPRKPTDTHKSLICGKIFYSKRSTSLKKEKQAIQPMSYKKFETDKKTKKAIKLIKQ